MSDHTSSAARSLADRVGDRVAEARSAYDRRVRATRPKSRARSPRLARPLTGAQSSQRTPEVQSLRDVFTDMGDTYRQYRRETGRPSTPGLRQATSAFKEAPTLASLVAVAAFLDELGILAW